MLAWGVEIAGMLAERGVTRVVLRDARGVERTVEARRTDLVGEIATLEAGGGGEIEVSPTERIVVPARRVG